MTDDANLINAANLVVALRAIRGQLDSYGERLNRIELSLSSIENTLLAINEQQKLPTTTTTKDFT